MSTFVRRRGERGAITVWTVLIVSVLIACAGLAYDTGNALSDRKRADAAAEGAARQGADALSQSSLRSGQAGLNQQLAINKAKQFLHEVGERGSVSIAGNTVRVKVTKRHPTPLLALVGLNSVTVHGEASAKSINSAGK